jgi:hypothetical protein
VPSKRAKFRKKYKKNNGKLPGLPKGGRPPGVPWSTAKKNPSPANDLLYEVLPAGGGFVVTKVVARIAYGVAEKRRSKWAKHIGVLASLGTFGILWAAAHRVKQIAEYHTPIVVGSAIAALQTVVQTYIPQYGWLIGHPSETDQAPANQVAAGDSMDYDNLLNPAADDDYTYDEQMEAPPQPAAQNGNRRRPRQGTPAQQAAKSSNDDLEDLLNDITDEQGEGAGIFSN